jgi:TorA maturation chaperone TorD
MNDDDFDLLIAQIDKEIAKLLEQVTNKRLARDHLIKAKRLQSGESPKNEAGRKRYKLPDAIKDVLKKASRPTHADELTAAVQRLGFIKANKQSVTSILSRWNTKGTYVRRTAPNTYEWIKNEGK